MIQGDEKDHWMHPTNSQSEPIEIAYTQFMETSSKSMSRSGRYTCEISDDGEITLKTTSFVRQVAVVMLPMHDGATQIAAYSSDTSESDSSESDTSESESDS